MWTVSVLGYNFIFIAAACPEMITTGDGHVQKHTAKLVNCKGSVLWMHKRQVEGTTYSMYNVNLPSRISCNRDRITALLVPLP